jgi:hypothetical protein
MLGMVGWFEVDQSSSSKDRYWFVESNYSLLGFHESLGASGSTIEQQGVPIDRDSSFTNQQFSQLFTPVLVGTNAEAYAGVYIDSTLVRGNEVGVLEWSPSQKGLVKPLRYSLEIPDNCVQMNPVHLTDQASSFTIPLFCETAQNGVEFRLVTP